MNRAPKQNIERARSYHITGASLKELLLTGADLTSANLAGADLSGAEIDLANLSGANLTGANLAGAQLDYSDLSGANLTGANLTGANLIGANLTGANLTGANLYAAHLERATITSAQLESAHATPRPLEGAEGETPAPALITYTGHGISKTLTLPAWQVYPTEHPTQARSVPPQLRQVLASRIAQTTRAQVQILSTGAELERSETRAARAQRAAHRAELKHTNTASALSAHLAQEGLRLKRYVPLELADTLSAWADTDTNDKH